MRPPGPSRIVLATLTLGVVLATAPPPRAAAQEEAATLRLVGQTPAATGGRPLRVTVAATNLGGAALGDLALSLWIYNPARSRSAYHQGLDAEPPTEPLLLEPTPVAGTLEPGRTRELAIERKLPELAGRGENALYPIKVQLESGGVAVATLRTSVVFIAERPLVPLNVSLAIVLDAAVTFRPDGTLLGTAIERAIAPEGRLETIVAALEEAPVRSTLFVSPLLVERIAAMGDGYRVLDGIETREVPPEAAEAERARAFLERLRAVARSPSAEVVALPYAGPSVSQLVASGLTDDLLSQIAHGRAVLEQVLGAEIQPALLYPRGSRIDPGAIEALPEEIVALVLDPAVAAPPADQTLTPPPTARIAGERTALVADPDIQTYLGTGEDPRLQAQRVIGELSALYFELPSQLRGAALLLDEATTPDPSFLLPLFRGLAEPPPQSEWLRTVKATQLLTAVPADHRRRITSEAPAPIASSLVAEIRDGRAAIAQFESMAPGAPELPSRLRSWLLVAESGDLAGRESTARLFVDAVRENLAREFDKIDPPDGTSVTLTSRGGVIPVTMRNTTGYEVRVRISLRSPRLDFLEGASREVTLASETQALTFPVRAQTTGRFPVRIVVETPTGRRISESQIVVRSTAYNRIALIVTIGAALFLAAWWGRRFLRRRTA